MVNLVCFDRSKKNKQKKLKKIFMGERPFAANQPKSKNAQGQVLPF